ncbi:sorting nexin-2-like [Trichogramma pretiosum]|uniref:sorting nexin-2-like n=1 Tax=Trichogramma pretiosum TaxID=7493 RepID=UPI0006C9710B|nr:sorting nexin-2-like [Trichogramma pretiosum]
MADNKELPPLFDNEELKNDMDFDDDDDSDIFASAISTSIRTSSAQDHNIPETSSPFNGQSSTPEDLPKLSLKDTTRDTSISTLSSPVAPSGPLSPPLDPTNTDIDDLHDVPINDDHEDHSFNVAQSQSIGEEPTESSDQYLKITVTSPQKMGDGMGSYVAYKVETKTNIQLYRNKVFSVNRRFSDFLGLHDKLTEKFLRSGRIIPPAPEKSVIGTTKIKMSGEKSQEQNSGSSEFLERRRAALERFLNRLASHPLFCIDPDVREFLEADMELPKATNTSALSGAGVMRLFNKVGETVNKITYKMDENDSWFEETITHIDCLDSQLRSLNGAVESLTNQRKELASCTGATARSIAVLGHGEPSASLGRALAQLAETLEKVEVVRKAQANSDLYQFGEMIRDYVALIGAIKDVFHERVKVFQNWQHAQIMLNKKREQKARMEQTGRSDKTNQAATEVIEWEAKVERGQEEFDKISTMIRKEVERFETVRVHEFKKQLIQYLEAMLQHQNQLIKHWESFLPEAKAVA